ASGPVGPGAHATPISKRAAETARTTPRTLISAPQRESAVGRDYPPACGGHELGPAALQGSHLVGVGLGRRTANKAPVVTVGPAAAGVEITAPPGRRRTVRLSREQVGRLLERYQAGQVSVRELAREFGIDRSTLLLHVQR